MLIEDQISWGKTYQQPDSNHYQNEHANAEPNTNHLVFCFYFAAKQNCRKKRLNYQQCQNKESKRRSYSLDHRRSMEGTVLPAVVFGLCFWFRGNRRFSWIEIPSLIIATLSISRS